MTLDALAALWAQEPQLSLTEIGLRVGATRSVVAGRIFRLRRQGDSRFSSRPPKPKATPKPRKLPPEEHVGNSRPLSPEPSRPRKPRLLIDLGWNGCRWPTGEAPDGRHLFCAQPQAPGRPYCQHHCERVKGVPGTGAKFALRAIAARPR